MSILSKILGSNDDIEVNPDGTTKKLSIKARMVKKFGKRGIIIWMCYQAVKGTITTTFIWIPLILYYWDK